MTKSRSKSFNKTNELKLENINQNQNKSYNLFEIKNKAIETKSNISYEKVKHSTSDIKQIMGNK